MTKKLIATVIFCALLAFYFSRVGFHFDFVEQLLTGVATLVLLYISAKKGWQSFWLVVLTTFTSAIALGCAFLNLNNATGPLSTNFTFSPLAILTISMIIGVIVLIWNQSWKSKDAFATILLVVFVINWLILAFNVTYFDDWKLENYLTVPFVILIYITHRWFKLSNVSYGLIFAYMMLHIYGSHYTYSEVPFGFWLQDVLDLARNHYDRIVHFSFGLLLAYPLREMIIRISDAKGFWSFWFPVEFILAFSCVYELIEWGIAVIFGGDLGIAYLGSQGDVWDAQKDMFLAGMGSIVAMVIVFFIVWRLKRSTFWVEFKESFKVKHKRLLGEEALRRMGDEK